MDRRLFLRNSALLAAGTATLDSLEVIDRIAPRKLFAAWPTMRVLYGDARYDDTLAVEALLTGHPVFDARTKTLAPPMHLSKGTYRVTRPVDALTTASINGAVNFVSQSSVFSSSGDRIDYPEYTPACMLITGRLRWKRDGASGLLVRNA